MCSIFEGFINYIFYFQMPSISRKTTQQRWQTTNTVSRTGPSRSIGGPRMEPPTPTCKLLKHRHLVYYLIFLVFSVTPTGSQERATSTRRKIQPSASTTSDRN